MRKEGTSLKTKAREDPEAEVKIGQLSTSLNSTGKEHGPKPRHD